jgi:hypothetical protein
MTMRATTIRFSEDVWELVEQEARRQGISTAQLIRDAAVLRVAYLTGKRGDDDAAAGLAAAATADGPARRGAGTRPAAVADPRRLASLRATALLDTPREAAFDRLAGLAARLLDAPIALVTLVDEDRQFFKSCPGLPSPWAERRETPLSHSVCQHVVDRRRPLVSGDLRDDPALRDNLAIPDIGVVAYAGVPLVRPDGQVVGSLCAIDTRPRHWTADQVEILEDLAGSVVSEIELRTR